MDLPDLQDWLRDRTARESRGHLALGLTGGLLGWLVALATAGLTTTAVFLVSRQMLEIGRLQWGWQTRLEPTVLNLGLIAALSLATLFIGNRRADPDYVFYLPSLNWRANESAGLVLGALWDLFKDLLFAGPRLVKFSAERLRLGRDLRRVNRDLIGRVLFLLHCVNKRVPFTDIRERIPEFDEERDIDAVLLVRGVLHLPSDPPGLSINSDLKKEFGASPSDWESAFHKVEPGPQAKQSRAPDQADSHVYEEIRSSRAAKPPAFRCTGCRRKFRLRNLQGGVVFRCPLCDTEYRTVADSRGRVRVEVNTEFYDPLADVELSNELVDAYLVLGLPPEAGLDEAKRAYRRLMKQYHPDATAGLSPVEQKRMEERSKEINRAYAEIIGKA